MPLIILGEGLDGQNRTKQKINYIFLRQGMAGISLFLGLSREMVP